MVYLEVFLTEGVGLFSSRKQTLKTKSNIDNQFSLGVCGELNLHSFAAQMAVKWVTINTGTEQHACIGIENHTTLHGQHGQEHGSWAHVPYEKNIVAQHGGHNPANTLTQACTFTLDIFDIGHPYYGML